MTFQPGEPVEYDSAHKGSKGTYFVIRGVYVKRVNAEFSDVAVAGRKPLLVRTSRLRRSAVPRYGGGHAA